ncbi:MAG: hypothetical protein WD553_02605, partial [Gemmatimonadaceae bacterium]
MLLYNYSSEAAREQESAEQDIGRQPSKVECMKLSRLLLGLMLLAGIPAADAQVAPGQRATDLTGQIRVRQVVRLETLAGVERSGKLIGIGTDTLYLKSGSVAKNQIIRLRVFEGTRARR